jgi:hypothetical protein
LRHKLAAMVAYISISVVLLGLIPQPVLPQSKTFIVPPTNKRARYTKAKSKERLRVSGEIKIIPLLGATVVIATPNLGQIIIGKLFAFPSDVVQRFEELDASGYTVDATGFMITLCSDREIKRNNAAGCRIFDESKPITIRQY